jgi:hypothetical protein
VADQGVGFSAFLGSRKTEATKAASNRRQFVTNRHQESSLPKHRGTILRNKSFSLNNVLYFGVSGDGV